MAGGEDSEGLERAIVHGQPESRDVEGRRLLEAVRAKMFADKAAAAPVEIGRYRILRRIGQGGMGVVYEAHDPELDRKVALKLVRPGPGVRKDRPARLLREAQALALLSHPNVVPVYDAGKHADQVFLAMAYIQGKSMDRWQAQLRPWPLVVKHYLAAGRGLAAAHAAGLVHRDFKPANVMLADDGHVHVMDFGLVAGQSSNSDEAVPKAYDVESVIARLDEARPRVEDDPAAWEALTRSGQIVGTYSYMPPEQQEGKAAEALADQFAYCTAFLEALQGEFPFVGDTPDELYESKRVGRFVADPPRPDIPRALRRVLLRGLSAQPDQRWPDMETLLRQVERSVRKRWWVAAIGGSVMVTAGAVVWVALSGSSSCDANAELAAIYGPSQTDAIAESMRKTGLRYADRSVEQVRQSLDAYADEWSRAYEHACALPSDTGPEVERRRRCLEDRRRALAALVTVLTAADERATEDAVELAAGLPAIERCSDDRYLSLEVQWPEDPRLRDRVEQLRQQITSARALTDSGRYGEARLVLDEVTGDPDTEAAPALRCEAELAMGILLRDEGNLDGATRSLEQAYFRAVGAGHYEVAAEAGTRLVVAYGSDLGQTVDARTWARHAHGPIEELGGDPLDKAYLDHARGLVFLRDGQHEAAQAAFERALEAFRARLGSDHPSVASSLHSLGATTEAQGRFAEAVTFHREALQMNEELFGESHPKRAQSLGNLANAELRVGMTDQALAHLREALEVQRSVLGEEHIDVATSRSNLGVMLQEMGRFDEAADVQRQALAGFEANLGRDHVSVAVALVNLAATLNRLERWLGATTALDRAQAIFDARLAEDHPYRVNLATERALTQRGQGDMEAAQRTLEAAAATCDRRIHGDGACVEIRTSLAELLRDADPQRARQVIEQARARYDDLGLKQEALQRRLADLDRTLPPPAGQP